MRCLHHRAVEATLDSPPQADRWFDACGVGPNAPITVKGIAKMKSALLHIERSATVVFDAAAEAVFELPEPQGRARRIKSWNMEYLYPESGDARPGTVTRQVHRSGAVEQVWLLAEHEPATHIKYVIFVPGMEVWESAIRLRPAPDGRTLTTVEHRITALAEHVDAEVQQFADGFDENTSRDGVPPSSRRLDCAGESRRVVITTNAEFLASCPLH